MSRAGGRRRPTTSRLETHPPPGARIMLPMSRSSSVRTRSSWRKCPSPFSPKISAMVFPSRRSISWSKSRKVRARRSATPTPTVDLPAPGNPTSTRCGRRGSAADTGFEVRKVAVIVAPRLHEGVAPELLEEGLGEHEGSHALRDHAHCRYRSHVTALGDCGGGLSRAHVYGRQRTHEGRDRLHPHM